MTFSTPTGHVHLLILRKTNSTGLRSLAPFYNYTYKYVQTNSFLPSFLPSCVPYFSTPSLPPSLLSIHSFTILLYLPWIESTSDHFTKNVTSIFLQHKAGYTAIQSRTVGQEQKCRNCLRFRNVTDGRTDGPTRQGVESRVRD